LQYCIPIGMGVDAYRQWLRCEGNWGCSLGRFCLNQDLHNFRKRRLFYPRKGIILNHFNHKNHSSRQTHLHGNPSQSLNHSNHSSRLLPYHLPHIQLTTHTLQTK
jgi:hypothetical protein